MYEQLKESQVILQNLGDCYYNNSQMIDAVRVYGKLFLSYKDSVAQNIILNMHILYLELQIIQRQML